MRKKLLIIFTMLFFLSPKELLADTANIELSGEREYKAIQLTPELYKNINSNLSDIFILDNKGNNQPYFINNFKEVENSLFSDAYKTDIISIFTKNNDSYFDFYVEQNNDLAIQATSMIFNIETPLFAKDIVLEGSYDGSNWYHVQYDKLFKVNEYTKTHIDFQTSLNYNYYRIVILNNVENISIENASLLYNKEALERKNFSKSITPSFTQENISNYTVINIQGLKNTKIDTIKINSKDQYKRVVSFGNNYTSEIYNLPYGDTFYSDTVLNFDGYVEKENFITLNIHNDIETPIVVDSIEVSYLFDEVVFKAEKNKYKFAYNYVDVFEPPVYDIVNYKDSIIDGGYDIVTLGEISLEPDNISEVSRTRSNWTLKSIIVIAILCIGYIISKKLKNKNK